MITDNQIQSVNARRMSEQDDIIYRLLQKIEHLTEENRLLHEENNKLTDASKGFYQTCTELERAEHELRRMYKQSRNNPLIGNPVVYALYRTWTHFDKETHAESIEVVKEGMKSNKKISYNGIEQPGKVAEDDDE